MNKIIFISDFFSEHVLGGAEINDKEIIDIFKKDFNIGLKRTFEIDRNFLELNKDAYYFISNFCFLKPKNKQWFIENGKYIIYEHDYKCLKNRNPSTYKEYKIPQKDIINYFFYKNALSVFCQSNKHKEIISKIISPHNVISVSGNMWSIESLELMRQICKNSKEDKYSILHSNNELKGTEKAIQYCVNKNLPFELVSDQSYFSFLNKLGKNKNLIFIPSVPETLSRISCEARMMGMSVTANQMVAATFESWFVKKGEELIDLMFQKRKEIPKMVLESFKKNKEQQKLISIITTFNKDGGFLDGFLSNMIEQTIFDKCELVIVDAGSSGDEKQKIKQLQQKYDNIKYIRLEQNEKPTKCLNIAIKESCGQYLTFGLLDDRKSKTCLEDLYEEISKYEDIDLVYGTIAQSDKPNETFEQNLKNKIVEHTEYEFSKENMVKCLPGPMPLWKKSIHDKVGFFDEEECDYADDWEMWLRMIDNGSKFKRVNKIVGLYLIDGRSQQGKIEQRQEEAKIFFKYSHIFGASYYKYYNYFKQFKG